MDLHLHVQVPKPYLAIAVIAGTIALVALLTAVLLFFRLYANKQRLVQETLGRHDAETQNQLSKNRIKVAERTIQQVSAALHDHLGHHVTFLCTLLADQLADHRRKQPFAAETIGKCHLLATEVLHKLRKLHSIIQAEQLLKQGLTQAIHEQITLLENLRKPTVTTNISLWLDDTIDTDAALHIYRILQEATTNAFKHANAERLHVSLTLAREGWAELVVSDDGMGFEATETTMGFGLGNMHERAAAIGANLTITSTRGQGTELRLGFPCATAACIPSNNFHNPK